MLPQGAIFVLKIHQNAFAAVASPRTPLGELNSAPRPSCWFSVGLFKEREERKGEGSVPPFLF